MENLWDYLGKAIAQRHPLPRDGNELKITLLEEWKLTPQIVITNIIANMKNML